jgi:hypothetical protein
MKERITLKSVSFWIFLTLVAIWPALYNQFPLVTPDTGSYIHSGIRLTMGIDRPWGYGIYILLTSWDISLWGPVLVQGILFAWLISELCKKVLGGSVSRSSIAMITILATFGTSAAWFNSQLMADAFTGFLLIAILLLVIGGNSKRKTIFLNALIFFALLTHNAHVTTTLLMSIILFFYFRHKQLPLYTKIARRLFLLSTSSILLLCTAYAIGGYGFRLSPVSHMFLISRMAENGILDRYLAAHCPIEHYSLCEFQGNTGDRQWNFMWDGNFPHRQDNGWINSRKEYNEIIYGSLRSPKYLGMHIVKNTEAGFRQLGQIYVGDGIGQDNPKGSSPYDNIEKYFPHELKEFRSSVQNTGKLPFQQSNFVIISFAVLTGIMTFYLSGKSNVTANNSTFNWATIFGILILFIVINAFITATFSTVIARLQARVFWVLPTVCVLYIYWWFNNKDNRLPKGDEQTIN